MSPSLAIVLFAAILMNTQPALAYIEPGSGGMMVQMLVTGTVGLWMWLRLYWNRLARMFRKGSPQASVSRDKA